MDHLKSLDVAKRSAQLMGDGGAHLNDSNGPVHLLPEEAHTHVDHCGAHKGSLSMQESPVTADICAKLETSAKFLRGGDTTPSVQVHMRIICGFDPIPEGAPQILKEYYERACERYLQTPRDALMPGDCEGEVKLSEIEKGFSVGNSIRWEYHCETNERFWALRHVLPDAIYLQWGLGVHAYDWGKTKAREVYEILRDPVNIFYMAILRVDTLLMYGSCFQVYQMKGDVASRNISGPEAAWMGYRIGFQEQLRYVRCKARRKLPNGTWAFRSVAEAAGAQLRFIALPRDSPLQNRLIELGCGQPDQLTMAQVCSTLANHFRCRLRGVDRYYGTEAFSNHSLIQAMLHEDVKYDSDCDQTRKALFTFPSERALHAASILVLRREGTAGHWFKRGEESRSAGARAAKWGWRFAGRFVVVNRQLCVQIYKPSPLFFERAARTYLEKSIEAEPYASQLERFAEGSAYYRAVRLGSCFSPASLNPKTGLPWPLRYYPNLFDMLIGGLAGFELIGSGHLERCMSVFTSMAGSRKRNVREATISMEVRSPACATAREAMGMTGWSRVFAECAPLQQKLKSGFYCGDQVVAYVRKLTKRQLRGRKRDKAIDYDQKDRRGCYLFEDGMAATGKKRKHARKDRQKEAARELYAESDSSISQDGDVEASADDARGASAGDWDPDLDSRDCEECCGIEGASRLAACIDCGVVHCETCIESLGELQEPFYCSACISDDETDGGNSDAGASSIDPNLACSICKRSDDDANMLVCDGCAEGFHFRCVGLQAVPAAAEWYCEDCASVKRAEMWLKRKRLDLRRCKMPALLSRAVPHATPLPYPCFQDMAYCG